MSIKAAFAEASRLANEFLGAHAWEETAEWKSSSEPTIVLMYDGRAYTFTASCADGDYCLEPSCSALDPEGAVWGLVYYMRAYIENQWKAFDRLENGEQA